MIKSKTLLEHKIGERVYEFHCDPNSPLGELHDALTVMRNFIIDKIRDIDSEKKAPECSSEPCKSCEE